MKLAATHLKAMANRKLLSKAFFHRHHKFGVMAPCLRQSKKQKRVPSIIVN